MSETLYKPKRKALRYLIYRAFKFPFDGQSIINDRHVLHTTALTEDGRPITLIVTFDQGTHASGWWRNSEYDRCLHLSLSHPVERHIIMTPDQKNRVASVERREAEAWAEELFGPHTDKLWIEPPASVFDPHRAPNVMHVRLFLDQQNLPILPTGEVYHLKPFKDGSSPEKIFRRLTKS